MYYPDYYFSEILPHADSPETLMQSLKLISHGFLNRIKSLKGISMGKSMYYMQEALKEVRNVREQEFQTLFLPQPTDIMYF